VGDADGRAGVCGVGCGCLGMGGSAGIRGGVEGRRVDSGLGVLVWHGEDSALFRGPSARLRTVVFWVALLPMVV
jgi:hypothetical protein